MPRWWSAMQAMSLRGGRLRLRALAGGAVPLTSSAPSLPPSFPFRSYSSLLAHPFTQSSSCLLPCHRPPCFSIPFPLSSSSSSSLVSSLLCVHRVPVRTIKRVARKKLKSHSGSKKRFRFTRSGLIMRWRANKSHKAWTKSSARLRRLSRPVPVYRGHVQMIRRSLPYGWKHSR